MRKDGRSAANKVTKGFEDSATNKQHLEIRAEGQVQL